MNIVFLTGSIIIKVAITVYFATVAKAGSKIIYFGNGRDFLIGPETEKWDAVLLAKHQSVKKFMEFAQNEDYLKNAGHRTAAIEERM
ncbi:hypothetical protein [Flexithrix dorotheae]|uniref:hypothetical protein n=1 Tax=Flexithrix dorotheae TaxID=70993 RepID=UPI000371E9B0|nr:hypothetical protein [Flexithrix dorotheae]